MIKLYLYRWILPRLIAKACDSRIRGSGKSWEDVNCYVVALNRDDSPYFMATSIDGDVLTGMIWDGNAFNESVSVSLSDLDSGTLNITHYYGTAEVNYDSVYSLHGITLLSLST